MSRMRVACVLGVFLVLLQLSHPLLLGAFNIQCFGNKKASDVPVMDIISQIVHRYDIILIQEVRDSDMSATKKLMERVNRGSPLYSYIVSEPLGPSTYKETYLFLYRDASVSVAGSYTYTNIPRKFSREPFVVMFSPKQTAVGNFVLIPQHTSPSSAVEEIDALYDVVDDVYRRWKTKDILLLGDFNAGCNYVTGSDWQKIRLFTDKSFHWLITNDVYTMVTGTPSSYDRIVVTNDMKRRVVPGSAEVYDYMTNLGLNHSFALAVSDHFPVQVELTG
uniref:Deoxyribonuclease n=1 Tax=Tetraodon nigroviridis TaxID=99883 RepID=H3C1K4_TETNG